MKLDITINLNIKGVNVIMAPLQGQVQLSITVTGTPGLTIDASNMPASAVVGSPYSGSLAVSGGIAPYSFVISAGSLPAGLTLDPVQGTITGTPTAAGANSFTVNVTDSTP